MSDWRKCCIYACINNKYKTRQSNNARLFKVPEFEYGRQWREWITLQNSPLKCDIQKPLLCDHHFQQNCFLPNGRLAFGAVPTVSAKKILRMSSGKKCSIFSCPNNTLKTRRCNNARLFHVPLNEKGRQWRDWIATQNSPLVCSSKYLNLCGLHFQAHCFLPTGRLAFGSMPTISANAIESISDMPSTPDVTDITLRDILDTSPRVLISYAPAVSKLPDEERTNGKSIVSPNLGNNNGNGINDKGIASTWSQPSHRSTQIQVDCSPIIGIARTLNVSQETSIFSSIAGQELGLVDPLAPDPKHIFAPISSHTLTDVRLLPDAVAALGSGAAKMEQPHTDTASVSQLEPQIESIKSEVPSDLNSSFGRCSPEWCAVEVADDLEASSQGAVNVFEDHDPLAEDDLEILEDKNQLCRICGTKQDSLSPIYNDDLPVEEDALTVAKKIETYLPLKIATDEGLPLNICLKCQNLLESWHLLYVTCLAADSELRKKFATGGGRFVPFSCTLKPAAERAKLDIIPIPHHTQEDEPALSSTEYQTSLSNVNEYPTSLSAVVHHCCRYCDDKFSTEQECRQHESMCVLEPATCYVSEKGVLQRNYVKSHLKTVHGPKSTECEICGKKFSCNSALVRHMNSQHNRPAEPINICEPCCKDFSRTENYKNHMATHKGKVVGGFFCESTISEEDGNQVICVCPVCEAKFPNKLSLIRHMNSNIKKQCLRCMKLMPSERFVLFHKCKYWFCMHCEMKFNTRVGLDDHERSHGDRTSFTCKTCGAKFTSQTDIVTHMQNEGHAENDSPCDSSSLQTVKTQPMNFLTEDIDEAKIPGQRSVDVQIPSKSSNCSNKSSLFTSYKCQYCGDTFPLKEERVQHTSKCALEPAFCDVCGQTISKRCLLKTHLRRHKLTEQSWYVCEKCGKMLSTKSRLERHLNISHVKEPKLICEPCCKLFYCKSSYLRHKKRHKNKTMKSLISNFASVENGSEVSYICPVCGKKFPDKMAVIIHLHVRKTKKCAKCKDIILNERHSLSHKCSELLCCFCGKMFKKRTSFSCHMRNHKATGTCGTTESCKICGGRFVNIYQHYAMHKPPRFKCEECGKAFRWNESLRLHKEIHEGATYTCAHCLKVFKVKRSLEIHCKKVHLLEKVAPVGHASLSEVHKNKCL